MEKIFNLRIEDQIHKIILWSGRVIVAMTERVFEYFKGQRSEESVSSFDI
jgi:hypothetical protein